MIVGAIGVADRAAIAHQLVQFVAERLGYHHEGRHRQQGRGDRRHQRAELHVAGQHHMGGAQAALRRHDALAHAGRIDRERRCILENAGAGVFGQRRQAERIVERMNMKRLRKMHGVEVAPVHQLLAHLRRRPHLGVGADPAQTLDIGFDRVGVVGLVDVQPAGDLLDARHAGLVDGAADIIQPALRQRPQLLGVIEPDALDHVVDALGITRQHEAGIAAGRRLGDAAALQHRHRPATRGDLARGGEAGQPRADHADVDVEIVAQPRARRACHPRRLIPARRRTIVFVHRYP